MHELLALALQQTLHRDARRLRHHPCNIRTRHPIVQHCQRSLRIIALAALALRRQLLIQLRNRREAQPAGLLVLALPLCDLELALRLLETLLDVLDLVEARALRLPHLRELRGELALLLQRALDLLPPLDAEHVRFVLERLALDLERHDLAVEGFELVRLALLSEAQGGGGLVNKVNGLVGEVTIGDIPRAVDGRFERVRMCNKPSNAKRLPVTRALSEMPTP